jgi:penicillin-binding protein 1A
MTHCRELAAAAHVAFVRPLLAEAARRARALWHAPGLLVVPLVAALVVVELRVVLPLATAVLLWSERPPLEAFLQATPPTIGRVEDGRGVVLVELARERRVPFEADELPPVLVDALRAAEDRSFFEHDGVEPGALPRVLLKTAAASLRARRLMLPQGGSTITQQLVRAVLLGGLREREAGPLLLYDGMLDRAAARVLGVPVANKLRRKAEEIRLSYWLEAELAERLGSRTQAKLEILRRYANYVYLGQGRYGFAAASELYLGRPLASLCRADAAQAALLAGLPKNPGEYAPIERNRERAQRRRDLVLGLMARDGFITDAERARAVAEPVRVVEPARLPQPPIGTAGAVGAVFDALVALDDPRVDMRALYDGRLVVRSTVVKEVQATLTQALESGLRRYEARHPEAAGRIQGAAVALANRDGRVLALCGGRQFYGERSASFRDFNRATQARRQPGSALKPLVYLAAFRGGATLDTRVLDAPIAVSMGPHRPAKWIENYDGEFRGPISMRRALAESRNAATVRLVNEVGVPRLIELAQRLGIHTRLQPVVATGLGGSEVTLLELAAFYRSLAAGSYAEPWLLQQVATTEGALVYRHVAAESAPLDAQPLAEIQEALRGVVRLPDGTGHALATLPVPVMGKTGTTNDFRDALFVGSTWGPGGITLAVRIGFDDYRPLGAGETGARAAMPVFREAILALYSRGVVGPVPRFPRELERGIDDYLIGRGAPEIAPPGELVAQAGPPGGATPGAAVSADAAAPLVLAPPPVQPFRLELPVRATVLPLAASDVERAPGHGPGER